MSSNFCHVVNICLSKKWEKRLNKDPKEANFDINWLMVELFRDTLKKLAETKYFQKNAYILEAMESYAGNTLENMRLVSLEESRIEWEKKEARKKRRAQLWSNMAGIILNGISSSVNSYMANLNISSHNAANIQYKDYGGSMAEALSNPSFLRHEQQRLLQMSINQVQWAEMQEYNKAREAYQRMGKDISLEEFRAMQGQAIMDAKNHEYGDNNNFSLSAGYEDSSIGNTSTQISGGFKCAYCNGSGRIERNDNAPASFGLSKANKKCNECGKIYDPTVFNHYHVQCGHCGGTGNAK